MTFDDGLLVWSPSGRGTGIGSQPFSVRVGQAWGEAAELVHVVGHVAEVEPVSAADWLDAYAVCSASDHDGPVRVVGFLPPWLFTSVEPAEVAAVAGLGFARYVPEPGRDINEVFPGVMPSAPALLGLGWFYSALMLVGGLVFVLEAAAVSGALGPRVLFGLVGAGIATVGLRTLPPVARLRRRLRRRARPR